MSSLPAVLALGVVVGLQASLLGAGIVLIYRTNRFVNFAQGQMGSIAAAILATLVFAGVPYWPALLVALAAGAATGAGVERLLGWRLFDKSRLVLLVASIGVAQLILLLVVAGPLSVDPSRLAVEGYPEPFSFRWTIGSAVLTSSQVTTLIVAPLIAVGLSLFLTRTKTGRAIRGAASNPDAARLHGISVRRISLYVWVISGVVSSLAAILFAPTQPAIGFGDSGPGLLLRGLAAALLAGMYDFRIAVAAGVALGIVEQATVFYTDVAGLPDLAVALSLALGLLVRARVLERDIRPDAGLVVERSKPPLPVRLRDSLLARHAGRLGWIPLLAIVALAPFFRGLRTQERAVFLVFMLSFALVGISLSVLTGWAGQVSLGQFAFLGVGAYAAAAVDRHSLGIPVMILAGGAASAFASVVVGSIAVRFRGLFLGVVTLAFGFAARSWLFRQEWVTGDASDLVAIENAHLFGVEVETVRPVYLIGVVVLVGTVLSLRALRASSVGRAIVAVRDNDDRASAFGLTPVSAKLVSLAISGFVTGMGGALWAMASGTWSFAAFDPSMSFVLLSVAIVGGMGTLHGPILGAIAVFAWPFLVPDANTLPIRSFSSGLLLLVALLFFPGGIADLLEQARRRILALVADLAPDRFDPTDDGPSLVATEVSISFGGILALDRASIEVHPGEIVGLIGGNGAGKSTLLNCISGHLRPASGVISIRGQDVSDLPPEFRPHLGLARTFQDARLFPGLTVTETVQAALDSSERAGTMSAMVGAPWVTQSEQRKRAAAVDLVARFGLQDAANTLTGELSTGMRRICDLASVVAAEPSLVILDEPTAGLAQREVEAFEPLLRSVRDEYGCSMLLVEHDVPLMLSICDRIYCMESGRVIAEGTPDEIREDPLVIASYLGAGSAAIERSGAKDMPT